MSTHSEDSDVGILGDSAYEILTDSTLMTDDDDGSSVASLDDNMSLADTDEMSGRASPPPHDDPIPSFTGLDDQLSGSGMTARNDRSLPEDITFEELDEDSGELLSVWTKLADIKDHQIAEICEQLRLEESDMPTLISTLRQTMTKDLLVMDEPLRVIYVGSTTPLEEIKKKIGAALQAAISTNSSCSSSWDSVKSPKYAIVPISSFGSRSNSPDVEILDHPELEMVVDVCTLASPLDSPSTLSLWVNNNRNLRSYVDDDDHPRLKASGWRIPHLAVVYISDDDSAQSRMTRAYARQFMARHSIPMLIISQKPLYRRAERYSIDTKSVHHCIESVASNSEGVVHLRLPIDLSTFLKLNPRQLNRNLGCITGLVSTEPSAVSPAPTGKSRGMRKSWLYRLEKAPRDSVGNLPDGLKWIREAKREELWKIFLVGWLLVCALAGGSFGFSYMKNSKSPIPEPVIQPIVASSSSILSITPPPSPSSLLSLAPVLASSTSQVASVSTLVPKGDSDVLPAVPDIAMNESDQFQIHVLGKNHIILRPPQTYLLLKKAPRLYVHVTREGQSIPAELSKLFDGVYSLKIDDEDAWGLMNVSIRTKSKPMIREILEVDFGTPWLQFTRWIKVIEQQKSNLQVFLDKSSREAKERFADWSNTAGHRAAEVREAAMAKSKEFSEEISNGFAQFCSGTRARIFASGEGARYVQKAQQRAKSLWDRKREVKRQQNSKCCQKRRHWK